MDSNIIVILLSLLFAVFVFLILNLSRNYTVAKSSGFKCVILPTHMTSIPWLISGVIFRPLLDLLPEELRDQWVPYGNTHPD